MENNFCVVLLIPFKKLVVIPLKWVHDLQTVIDLNYGLRPYKKRLIFYSMQDDELPVFGAPSNVFRENESACYQAYILRYYSKFIIILLFILRKHLDSCNNH